MAGIGCLVFVNPTSHRTILFSLAAMVLVILLTSAPLGVMAEEEDTTEYKYKGSLEKVDKGLEPGTAGKPLRFMYDRDGSQMLLWGYEHGNDIRILDNDLTVRSVLALPYEDFNVGGVSLAESGRFAFAWGRSPTNATDVLVAYNLTDYSLDYEYMPEGAVYLAEIDDVNLMGMDNILVVAGRDGNGTNRVVFTETAQMRELKNDTIPDNVAVISVEHDGRNMVLVMDDGEILIYNTNNWSLRKEYQVFSGPFTSYEVKTETDWHFADANGELIGITNNDNLTFLNLSTSRGPIQAVYSVEYYKHLVVAVPEDSSRTGLDVWKMGVKRWEKQASIIIDGTVTSFVEDPANNNTFAVGLSDGSIEFYQVVVKSIPVPPHEPTWGDRYGKITGTSGVLVLIALVAFLIKRDPRTGDE